jgi:hemerythrin superfamily protein
MPRSSKKSSAGASSRNGRGQPKKANRRSTETRGSDAIALLKSDHREVEGWFEQFEKSNSNAKKQELAGKICAALRAHTTIEEEIFYPAFLEATEEKDLHHEAEVEHEGAKRLIAEIESAGPDDDYFDAKVSVLSEMIKHHVNEEEQRGGMFSKARESDMDLEALGEVLRQRKDEVMAEEPRAAGSRDAPARRGSGLRTSPVSRNGKGRQENATRRS